MKELKVEYYDKLKDELFQNMCDEGKTRDWSDRSYKHLAEIFINGLKYCIENEVPTLDFMDKHGKGKLREYGIFINEPIDGENFKDVICNGNSKGRLRYTAGTVSDITLRHESMLNLSVEGKSIVHINMYNDAVLYIQESSEECSIIIRKKGRNQIGGDISRVKFR